MDGVTILLAIFAMLAVVLVSREQLPSHLTTRSPVALILPTLDPLKEL